MNSTSEKQSLRSLSALYTNSAFRVILGEENLCAIENRVIKHKSTLFTSGTTTTFGNFMCTLYDRMSTDYCNEYIYKNSILNKLLLKRYKLDTTTLLNEFKIGKSIADLVFINGEVKLFEVKTDLDTLTRLQAQLDDYRKVAEKIYVVVSHKHIDCVLNTYSKSAIGIIELTADLSLNFHKEASIDKSLFDHSTLFKLLRKSEYLSIIKNIFGKVPDVPNTIIFKTCLEMIKTIEVEDFQGYVFKQLKRRKVSEPQLLLNEKTPQELRFLCHSLDLKQEQYDTLFNLLDHTI